MTTTKKYRDPTKAEALLYIKAQKLAQEDAEKADTEDEADLLSKWVGYFGTRLREQFGDCSFEREGIQIAIVKKEADDDGKHMRIWW